MKKFLSLVLALVMTMSLVTISAGAKDFTDDSKITYKEAVDVVSAVKVVDGYADGSFNPSATLTRGAAAKIICNLILGPTTAGALSADAAPFKDVPANSTFAGYIAYCAKEGIISGYADGTFRPGNTLTSYAYMKMLLGALGYDAEVEGYVGANWSINVAKQAIGIGLDKGLVEDFNGIKPVTREEAALYAFNTLKATMVEYEAKTSVSVGGAEVVIAGSKAKDVANSSKNDGNIKDDGKMQFAEKYFTNLKKVPAVDSFDRPATNWKIKSESVGTYMDTPDQTYTKDVKLGDIYADLGLSSKVAAKNVTMLEDGVAYKEDGKVVSYDISKGDAKKIGGDGVITEVFYDDDKDTATISMIHVYAGKVTGTHAATSNKDAYITVAPKWNGNAGKTGNFETEETYAVDDLVLYSYSMKSGEGVQDVRPVETTPGTLTGFTANKTVTVGGETYKANETIKSQIVDAELGLAKTYEVSLIVDENGYVVYVDTTNATSNYAVVLKVAAGAGDFNDSGKAKLLLTDGTTVTVDAKAATGNTLGTQNTPAANNALNNINVGDIVRYTVNNKDEYTLTLLADVDYDTANVQGNPTSVVTNGTSTLTLNANKATVRGTTWEKAAAVANGKTIFLVATQGNDGVVYTAYTGIKAVPTLKTKADNATKTPVTVYCKDGNLAKVVYVDLMTGKGTYDSNSKDVVVLLATSSAKTSYQSELGTYYMYDALVNGEFVEDFKVSNADVIDTYGAYPMFTNATYDSEKVATLSGQANVTTTIGNVAIGTKAAANGVVGLGGTYLPFSDDVQVFVIDEDGDLISETPLGISAVVDSDVNEVVYKVTDGEVTTIVVVEPAASKSDAVDTSETAVEMSSVVNKDVQNADALKFSSIASVSNANVLSMTYVAGESIATQLKEALVALGYKNVQTPTKVGTVYTIKATDSDGIVNDITFDTTDGTSKVVYKVTVDGKLQGYTSLANNLTVTLNMTASALKGTGTGFISNETGAYVYGTYAANAAKGIKVNQAVEVKTGYVAMANAALDASVTGAFDVQFYADDEKIATPAGGKGYMPYNAELKVELKVKGAALDLDADATADKITGTVVVPTSAVCSKAAMVDTFATGVLTFVKTAGAELAVGETVTLVYGKQTADVGAVTLVYAA